MALTRARITNIDTTSAYISDPIVGINTTATLANVDVGFIFNRNSGISPNVAIIWQESTRNIVLGFTANSGLVNSNVVVSSYANIAVGNLILAGTTSSTSNVTGAIVINGTGGIGVGGNIYVGQRVGFVNAISKVSAVYQVYNSFTNSLDTVFG